MVNALLSQPWQQIRSLETASPATSKWSMKAVPMVSSNEDGNNVTSTTTKTKKKLSRPERKALERQRKLIRRKTPSRQSATSYNLHSQAISELNEESTADDVLRAIKRAQNNHDHHDLKVIADFLIDECDVGFAYGYRGSLLARLAVAALHFRNHQVARRAIDIRHMGECGAMVSCRGCCYGNF